MQECHKHSMPYELQKFNQDVPAVGDQSGKRREESVGFEEQVRHYHDEFNDTLTKFLHEIATQEQDHFSGNVLHIIYRSVPPHMSQSVLYPCFLRQVGLQRVLRPDEGGERGR